MLPYVIWGSEAKEYLWDILNVIYVNQQKELVCTSILNDHILNAPILYIAVMKQRYA